MNDFRKYRIIDAETVENLEIFINRLAENNYRALSISSYHVNTGSGYEYQLFALMEHQGGN